MAENEVWDRIWGGGCNGLYELAHIHLLMAGNLESRGYTCVHQLQSDWGSFAPFRQNIDSTDTVCG